jgi:hypothetical protein
LGSENSTFSTGISRTFPHIFATDKYVGNEVEQTHHFPGSISQPFYSDHFPVSQDCANLKLQILKITKKPTFIGFFFRDKSDA